MADSLHLYMEPRGHRNSGVMGPLEGLRIVEFASDIAGPSAQSCSPTSAPMSPRSSHRQEIDSGAGGRPFPGSVPDSNRSGVFEYLNAGKRGATIDLDSDARRARTSAPHGRRPTHRSRADRGRGMRCRRAGDRILDERECPAARGQSQPRSRARCLPNRCRRRMGGAMRAR